MVSRSTVILVLLLKFHSMMCLQHGDQCSYSESIPGTCKQIYECAQAIKDMKVGKMPIECAITEFGRVICCPNKPIKTTPPTIKTTPPMTSTTALPTKTSAVTTETITTTTERGEEEKCSFNVLTLGTCKPLSDCPRAQIGLQIGRPLKVCTEFPTHTICCPLV